jgi:branched-chain amino acid transport system substrate-binding protein
VRRLAFLLAGIALLAAGCGKSSDSKSDVGSLVIAVDVPVSGSPYVAQTIHQGVELAASSLNAGGGIRAGDRSYLLKVKLYDNHLSARQAVEDTRRAMDAGAAAIVTDGTGVDATWEIARRDGVSICITHDGGTGLVDAAARPNVFRIAPTNHGIAFRYAEYLIPKKLKVALLSDDSAYGRQGAADVSRAFSANPASVALKLTLPAGQPDVSPQILRTRRSGPRSSSGGSRRRSPRCSRRRAASAGTFPCTRRRRVPTRSSASSSPTIRTGSTASPSPRAA